MQLTLRRDIDWTRLLSLTQRVRYLQNTRNDSTARYDSAFELLSTDVGRHIFPKLKGLTLRLPLHHRLLPQLHRNVLSVVQLPYIFPTGLKRLILRGSRFTHPDVFERLFQLTGSLPELLSLELTFREDDQWTPTPISPVTPQNFDHLSFFVASLHSLNCLKLTGCGRSSIASASGLKHLRELACDLPKEEWEKYEDAFQSLTSLQVTLAESLERTARVVKSITSGHLDTVVVTQHHLGHNDTPALSTFIRSLSHHASSLLTLRLELASNTVSDSVLMEGLVSLSDLRSLQELRISRIDSFVKFTDPDVATLTNSMGTLRLLDLNGGKPSPRRSQPGESIRLTRGVLPLIAKNCPSLVELHIAIDFRINMDNSDIMRDVIGNDRTPFKSLRRLNLWGSEIHI